ncbi:hypothetical protein LTR85_000759 [Meristemomyces frigidus]|nr:hypothetical protein LTR85_000759 [Meristemomyces frigidus]
MLTSNPTSATSATTLPVELWLEIIPHIPYTPKNISSLCLTCTQLNVLLNIHEHSLVSDIKRAQLGTDCISLFPSLNLTTYAGLNTLHNRLETLHDLHSQWLRIVNHGAELHWLKGRWESVHKAGLLLLYRLQDGGTYEAKVQLMQSLPATSLACLLFKLISSIKILRVSGPEPIHGGWRKEDVEVRSDVELAFEEVLLGHGPDVFAAMLGVGRPGRAEWAISILQTEVATMGDRQAPYPSGASKPPTLISSLRRALAGKADVTLSLTVSKMWEILSGTAFDDVDQAKMVKLVRGEEIERGMKRTGF